MFVLPFLFFLNDSILLFYLEFFCIYSFYSFLIFFYSFLSFCFPLNCIVTSLHLLFSLFILLCHFCYFIYCFLFYSSVSSLFLLLFLFCRFIVFFLNDYIFLHIFSSLSSTPSSSFSRLHYLSRPTSYYCSIT